MELKNRQGVLGLDTVKHVMITFLILAVCGIATLLSLVALQNGVGSTIDTSYTLQQTNNESDDNLATVAFVNQTGYNLTKSNSSTSSYVLVAIWGSGNQSNGSQGAVANVSFGGFNNTIGLGNATVNTSGIVFNASTQNYGNVSLTYYLTYGTNNNRTAFIVGNVSSGLVTFFASTGTIFSILVVTVIILAISIIIWAVGRFGQNAEGMGGESMSQGSVSL